MSDDVKFEELEKAVEIRKAISDLYARYAIVKKMVYQTARIKQDDFKRAVDAIHYFGGGWPSLNSRGRMEAAIENVAGMYRVLHFGGHGQMVEDHFAKKGILIQLVDEIEDAEIGEIEIKFLKREFNFDVVVDGEVKFKKLSDLVRYLLDEGDHLQSQICKLADIIRYNLKPAVKNRLGVEDEEYDRLFYMMRFLSDGKVEKVRKKKQSVDESVSSFIKNSAKLKK